MNLVAVILLFTLPPALLLFIFLHLFAPNIPTTPRTLCDFSGPYIPGSDPLLLALESWVEVFPNSAQVKKVLRSYLFVTLPPEEWGAKALQGKTFKRGIVKRPTFYLPANQAALPLLVEALLEECLPHAGVELSAEVQDGLRRRLLKNVEQEIGRR